MGISRSIRCDVCEFSEFLEDDVEPCDAGWLNLIYGPTEEDAAYFCSLPCTIDWARSDAAQQILAELAEVVDEPDEED